MAGYSGTPLEKKLGIRTAVALVHPPSGFALAAPYAENADVIVAFFSWRADLLAAFGGLRRRLPDAGGLWIAWPKRASKRPTDLTEDVVREIGLAAGLVDNKVCAIDEVWSGLRLVVRVRDRR